MYTYEYEYITSAHIHDTVQNTCYVHDDSHMDVGDYLLPWLLLLLAVFDLAGAQELTQYLVWDEDGEEEVEDTVTSTLFEAVDRDRDTENAGAGAEGRKPRKSVKHKKKKVGKKGKKAKKSKKSKGRKRKSTDSSSTSSESEQKDSSSSSSSVT